MAIVVKRGEINSYDIKECERVFNERINEFKGSVARNKREVLVVYRNIYEGHSEHGGTRGYGFSHFTKCIDAGIIKGEVENIDLRNSRMDEIGLSGLVRRRSSRDFYFFFS